MKLRKRLFTAAVIMTLILTLSASLPVAAQGKPEAGTEPAMATNIVDFIRLHPMSPEAEAAIIHEVPPFEFITIDGVKYESKDISLFDGHRLGFTTDRNGEMYAFTDPAGLKEFADAQRQPITEVGTLPNTLQIYGGILFQHVMFTGDSLVLEVNQGNPNLGVLNNQISSLATGGLGYGTTLFDYTNYGGDYVWFSLSQQELWTHGWNDRAESAIAFPW